MVLIRKTTKRTFLFLISLLGLVVAGGFARLFGQSELSTSEMAKDIFGDSPLVRADIPDGGGSCGCGMTGACAACNNGPGMGAPGSGETGAAPGAGDY